MQGGLAKAAEVVQTSPDFVQAKEAKGVENRADFTCEAERRSG